MKKNVCMFVWNHFTNDARVMRECITLSTNGYKVDLICIDDPNDPNLKTIEQFNENFKVYRVKRYPYLLNLLKSLLELVKKYKWLLFILFLLWLYFLKNFFLLTSILTLLLLFLYIPMVRRVLIRLSIIIRMIKKGYKKKYHIYHSNDLNTLPQGYVCSKLRFRKKKLIYDSHEVQTSRTGYNSPIYGIAERLLLRRVDAMIVENHTRAAYNEELYGFYPYVVHNYPFTSIGEIEDAVDLHAKLNLDKNEKILLYQGGIQIGRGLEKIIEATSNFNEGTVVFIGDGNQKNELIKLVEKKQLQNRIKFLPKVPLEELPKYTKNAYLGFQVLNNICFNHWSASSNKLFEYMMAKVPIVACDFPEIKKVVEGNNIGICINSHDPIEIAKGVNQLISDEDLRNKMSENCVAARKKYNWENEEDNLLKVYNNLQLGGFQ